MIFSSHLDINFIKHVDKILMLTSKKFSFFEFELGGTWTERSLFNSIIF